jgi:hypothetical protein
MILGISIKCPYAECRNDEWHALYLIMLNVIMLNVVRLNVVMLSVVAPKITTNSLAQFPMARIKSFSYLNP